MKIFNLESFLIDLKKNLNSVSLTNEQSVHQSFDNFINSYTNTLDHHAPLRNLTRKEKKLKQKPWITKAILTANAHKNKLYKQYLNQKTDESFHEYKKYRNKLTHIKENSKRKYYSDLIDDSKHNTSKMWNVVNDIIKYKVKNPSKIPESIIGLDDKAIHKPELISNTFNNFFSDIGKNMASNISCSPNTSKFRPETFIPSNGSSFFLHPITVEEVTKHLNDLNPSKSAGPENIPIRFIKMSTVVVAPILTELYNQCIKSSTYPNPLKRAQIIPIFKKGSKEKCSNYRPISLLSPFSKIFEKCLYVQLYKYFAKHKLLSEY